MRKDSLKLENNRLFGLTIETYPYYHERHRIFPEIFENRNHKKILDISAGIGIVAKQIKEKYECELHCNEINDICLNELEKIGIKATNYDLDIEGRLPFADASYDAIICLATLEHLINIDNFVKELYRILKDSGRLYLSVPNYAGWKSTLTILRGRTFHNPLKEPSKYEFYAHVRYFTYRTLLEYMEQFGFFPEKTYLALPKESTKIRQIRNKYAFVIPFIRIFMRMLYFLSPRWHEEPVICFAKAAKKIKHKKVIL